MLNTVACHNACQLMGYEILTNTMHQKLSWEVNVQLVGKKLPMFYVT